MNAMLVIQPNYMGNALANGGLEGIITNYGYGVAEATKANPESEMTGQTSSNAVVDKLRVQKSRQFGRTKDNVGF